MSAPSDTSGPCRSIFLSYASEDRSAAQTLRDALLGFGLQVWYDESGLDGGDAWDQKIRRQIRECDFFMPLISEHTNARPEGYFRREWRLAVDRTHDMADDHTFLLPVVIDDTSQERARVPERFLSVQWLRLPAGQSTSALEAVCRRLLSGKASIEPPKKSRDPGPASSSRPPTREYPPFPTQEQGQPIKFGFQVVGWAFQSGWVFFKGFPRWVQIFIYIWLAIILMSKGCSTSDRETARRPYLDHKKLKTLDDTYKRDAGDPTGSALDKQLAGQITAEVGEALANRAPLAAVPFSAPADNSAAQKMADATFAQVYGKLELSHHGQVRLTKEPLSAPDLSAAVERGRALHSRYVLFGSVDAPGQALTVQMVSVAGGGLLWSQTYPVATADPTQIAADINSKIPSLSD